MFLAIIWFAFLFLFLSSLLFCNGKKFNGKQYLIIGLTTAAFLSIISFIFSPEYSGDYNMFEEWFKLTQNERFGESWVSVKDPGFYFMSVAFGYIGLSYSVMNLFMCLLSIFLFTVIFNENKYRVYIFTIFLIYYSRFFYVHEFTQIRFSVSIALSTLGYLSFTKGRYIKSAIFIAAGVFFHISSVFCIIPIFCFFLPKKNTTVKLLTCLFLGLMILVLGINSGKIFSVLESVPMLYNRVLPYINGSYTISSIRVINTYFIVKTALLITISFLILTRRMVIDKNQITIIYITYLSTIIGLFFRDNAGISLRFTDYFCIFDIMFFIEAFYLINQNTRNIRFNKNVFVFGISITSIVWVLSSIKIFF